MIDARSHGRHPRFRQHPYAREGGCDESVSGSTPPEGGLTVNHTIEGSHAITNILADRPGVPAQQGGATTLITGPGQTVLVAGNQAPRYIPTPRFIADVASNMTAAKATSAAATATGETRDFSRAPHGRTLKAQQTRRVVGATVWAVGDIDATSSLVADPVDCAASLFPARRAGRPPRAVALRQQRLQLCRMPARDRGSRRDRGGHAITPPSTSTE